MQRIPVIVLSGFLGSGKTTLLQRLLKEASTRGLRSCLLMNELGKLDVDGRIIGENNPGVTVDKLLDGCICCSKKSEVAQSLQRLLTQRPDVIFIELTGVANPEEVADTLTEPQLLGKVSLLRTLTVIDAENVLDYNSIFTADAQLTYTLRRQIETADWLIVNKCDAVNETRLKKINKVVRKLNPSSPLFETIQCDIELSSLFQHLKPLQPTEKIKISPFKVLVHAPALPSAVPIDHEHNHNDMQKDHDLSFSRIQTLSFALPNEARIEKKQLEQLLKKWRPKLLRAKGYLQLSDSKESVLMQYAARRTTWQPSTYNAEPYLVLIGMDMDLEQIRQDVACTK